MLSRFARSTQSIRSLVSTDDAISKDSHLSTLPFEELLPNVCKKLNCEFDLLVKKVITGDRESSLTKKYFANNTRVSVSVTSSGTQKRKTNNSVTKGDPNFITITSVYENNRLVEIFIHDQLQVPRLLIQAIQVIAHLCEDMRRLTMRYCKINAGVIYELNQLVPLLSLTDLCLDDCFLPEANYAILLNKRSTLRYLSLCRCFINDLVCRKIVSKIHFSAPAEKNLLVLNLAGNCISDAGAKYIGEMLRTNKHLRYLNLAGNRIGDEGAGHILNALVEFPLTYDEVEKRRSRVISYLKRKRDLTAKFMSECDMQMSTSSFFVDNLTLNVTEKEIQVRAKKRAEKMAMELMGELQGPFSANDIHLKDGWTYCNGNYTLSYLNLSYNNLTYLSVKKVLHVLHYQRSIATGLLKIILEGNFMPVICSEYDDISAFINKKLTIHIEKELSIKKKRVSISKK